ncbi:MAG: DNA repair exonuclease [Bacteroidetes bacterium]|nr:DNA repair exonuclease [Bacteroidota bacterium]MCW5896710.1 DNA repair exonuclease [Bacteroidota bacterium]
MIFLHTADLQIGMTASSVGKLAKQLQEARVESLRTILRLGLEKQVNFVVIAGDMFETNQVSKKYIHRVARVLEEARPLRVFILPGNHDYFGPNSVYQTEEFSKLSQHITIFRERKPSVVPDLDLTLYPSPCFETRSNESPAKWVSKQPGTKYHVAILHGSIPSVIGRTSEEDEYFPMSADELKNLGMDYIALGHWHSLYPDPTTTPDSPFYYSGTPEPTGFGERMSGHAILVELSEKGRQVTAFPTAQHGYVDVDIEVKTVQDIEAVRTKLAGLRKPEMILLRLQPKGVVSIAVREALDTLVADFQSRVAYIRCEDKGLMLEPDETDLNQFTRSGIAATSFSLLKKERDQASPSDRPKYERAIALAYKAFKGTLD